MSTFLSVQHAARRLGVSPVTIRRWTATGFLPCTRTAGGHRRIAVDDIEELARAIGGSSQLAARRAREHELDTIVETSIALASEVDLQPLLAEIARLVTHLIDFDFCAVSTSTPARAWCHALAEYDGSGERLPDTETYDVRQFPLTARCSTSTCAAVVNVDDPRADAAEVAALRAGGDRSLLMLPLVYRGEAIGLLEASDARRARSYSRQELRLCQAVAGQAAVALHNTSLRAASRSGRDDLRGLCEALRDAGPTLAGGARRARRGRALERLARTRCATLLGAVSCVVPRRAARPGAAQPRPSPIGSRPAQRRGRDARARRPRRRCGRVTITVDAAPGPVGRTGRAARPDRHGRRGRALIEPGRGPAAPELRRALSGAAELAQHAPPKAVDADPPQDDGEGDMPT